VGVKMIRLIQCSGILLTILLFPQLLAQTHLNLSQAISYDQNINRNYTGIPDWIYQTSLDLSQDLRFKKLFIRLKYSGDIEIFQEYQERLFQIHQVGGDVALPLSNELALNAGVIRHWRINKADYKVYDAAAWTVFTHFNWSRWRTSPFAGGWQFRHREYQILTEFSYYENSGLIRLQNFFPTKTTFIGELNLAHKKYLAQRTVAEIIISEKPKPGKGHGYGWEKRSAKSDTTFVAYNLTVPAILQWRLKMKLAQSLTATTGLGVEYLYQTLPEASNRYLERQEYLSENGDELYDDPYSFGSQEWQFMLTQLLPYSGKLRTSMSFIDKEYSYPISGAQSPDELQSRRQDQQQIFSVQLSFPIKLSAFISSSNLFFDWAYLKNKSTDFYFDFKGNLVTGGIEISF